jgi:hypothetical protein
MNARFLGIPMVIWGGLALIVAVIFTVVWPSNKVPASLGGARYLILRWFHALVWILLALSFFVRESPLFGGTGTANILALAALILYLNFMATLFTS